MAHYYSNTGEACHFVAKKDGSGNRPSTIADARKHGWVPGVTTVLEVLAKPALVRWMVNTAVQAIVTAPDLPGEGIDAKIERVLNQERQQDAEAAAARDRGTAMHDAIESHWVGKEVAADIWPWIEPALKLVRTLGHYVCAEKVLVGDGYAGKTDVILETPSLWWIVDFKTGKKLPEKGSWPEHVLQLSAYAAAWHRLLAAGAVAGIKPIRTANCYISTTKQGEVALFENDPDWQRDFNSGFYPALQCWKWFARI